MPASPARLEGANIKDARTIILASQNDAMNLQIALKARSSESKDPGGHPYFR